MNTIATKPHNISPELINPAWWHYWSGNYQEMSRCLTQALESSSAIPSLIISDWINIFSSISYGRKHPFAIEQFTELPEWNKFLELSLKINNSILTNTLKNSPKQSSFALYRMLGNDLPPRHTIGQTFENLEFILNHEPPLHHCRKKWIVNKIVNLEQEEKILKLLDECHQNYIHLPFNEKDYTQLEFDFESFLAPDFLRSKAFGQLDANSKGWALDRPYKPKNIYIIGVNTIRNLALEQGRQLAEWTLVFDGGCFLTRSAWDEISQAAAQQAIAQKPCKHLIIPMARLTQNSQLFEPDTLPPPEEEPQIIFHKDSQERFDEALQYGRLTKVEMFRRLKYPGVWDKWDYKTWEQKQWHISAEAEQWQEVGWVARLSSGHPSDLDQSLKGLSVRTQLRQAAVWNLIDQIDENIFRQRFHTDNLIFFNPSTLAQFRKRWQQGNPHAQKIIHRLIKLAHKALKHPIYSVVQKGCLPPSGTMHDYLSLSAFSVPDPKRPKGPYVYRDGQRTQETELYSKESNRYDQTRLQRTLDNTTVLALAWYFTGEETYAQQAVKRVRTWFLEPLTKMNPHLKYAQMVMGDRTNIGSRYGIIDTKDLYYFLDALKLLRHASAWSDQDHQQMQAWCQSYLAWLMNSPQGQAESRSENNHATCYDLQIAALAGFCDDAKTLFKSLEYSKLRIAKHFDPAGKQPQELKRTDTLHYCTFNLQNWTTLAKIAENVGVDLWHYTAQGGENLANAFKWLLPYYQQPWPYQQNKDFNLERFLPLYYIAFDIYPSLRDSFSIKQLPPINDISPHPYTGIPSYWIFAFENI